MKVKTYDYKKDPIGSECLELASLCRSDIGFGAVLVKAGQIIGMGYNRRSTLLDRLLLTHVDYATHAEQAAIINAIVNNNDPHGAALYVLGVVLHGRNRGKLTVRGDRVFVCTKCPHTFERFDITVHIPHVGGWMRMDAHEAMLTGKLLHGHGYWKNFVEAK